MRVRTTPNHFAYVKISEGCDYPCTFCIIPKMRGLLKSRTVDSIVAEAGQLGADWQLNDTWVLNLDGEEVGRKEFSLQGIRQASATTR